MVCNFFCKEGGFFKVLVAVLATTVLTSADTLQAQTPIPAEAKFIVSLQGGQPFRIESHDASVARGYSFSSHWQSFAELIRDGEAANATSGWLSVNVSDLDLSFHHLPTRSLGLGLTYPSHQEEMKADQVILFEKNATATQLNDRMRFRSYLDYELEISILLHRTEPGIYGFMLHNDFTDRMIQGLEYNARNPGPSFGRAKSFEGANAQGAIMVLGDDTLWPALQATMAWNGTIVQTLDPKKNLLKPSEIHHRVFASPLAGDADWILIGTGTPAGTIFRAPTLTEKTYYLSLALFRPAKAKEMWVNSFGFLAPGDRLEFLSPLLGNYETEIYR